MARRRAIVNSHDRQARSSPLEAGQPPADLHPDLRRDVLGRFRRGHPQVAQQIRVTVTPQHRERGLAARLGGRHHLRKVVTDHSWEYRDQLTAPQPDCQDLNIP